MTLRQPTNNPQALSVAENPRGLWLAAAAMFFVNGAIYGAWATQIPLTVARLSISDAAFGSMLIAMSGGAIAAMSLSGPLVRAIGMRALLFASAFVLFLSFLPLCMLATVPLTLILMFVFGAAAGLLDVVTNAFAADVETRLKKHVMSSIHAMWSLGGLAGAAVGSGLLFLVDSSTQAMLICASLIAIFLAFQTRVTFSEAHNNPIKTSLRGAGQGALIIGALAALCFAVEGAVRDWSALYLSGDIGLPVAVASWGFSAFSLVMAIGRLFGDRLRAGFGTRHTVGVSALIAAAGFAIVASMPTPVAAILGFALVGMGLSNIVPILISVAGQLPNPTISIALVVALGYGGYLASPPAFGAIATHTSLAILFSTIAVMCAGIFAAWSAFSARKSL